MKQSRFRNPGSKIILDNAGFGYRSYDLFLGVNFSVPVARTPSPDSYADRPAAPSAHAPRGSPAPRTPPPPAAGPLVPTGNTRRRAGPPANRPASSRLDTRAWRPSCRQCCGSGMFIPDPDFYPSRIPDPGPKNSNKRER
jgi:hypothetical protein